MAFVEEVILFYELLVERNVAESVDLLVGLSCLAETRFEESRVLCKVHVRPPSLRIQLTLVEGVIEIGPASIGLPLDPPLSLMPSYLKVSVISMDLVLLQLLCFYSLLLKNHLSFLLLNLLNLLLSLGNSFGFDAPLVE